MKRTLVSLLLCCGSLSALAVEPDCGEGSPAEQMLCANPALRELDSDLQAAQQKFRSAAMINAWRDQTARHCANDADCLMQAYLDELAHTQRILVAQSEKQLALAVQHSGLPSAQIRGTGPDRRPPTEVTGRPSGKSPEEIFAIASRSIVLVTAYGKRFKVLEKVAHGSGVTIAPQRVVTNCHVIDNMEQIVVIHDGNRYGAKLLVESPLADICILQVDHLPTQPVKLQSLDEAHPGQQIYAIGNPLNIGLSISDGLLAAIVDKERIPEIKLNTRLIQFHAATWSGNSGGGLFDSQGRVLGIPTLRWIVKDQAPINFAVPLAELVTVKNVVNGIPIMEKFGTRLKN